MRELWFAGLSVQPVFAQPSEFQEGGQVWATSGGDGWLIRRAPAECDVVELPNLLPMQPLAVADTLLFRHPKLTSRKIRQLRLRDFPAADLGFGTGALLLVEGVLHYGSRWTFGKYWATTVMHQGLWLTTLGPKGPEPISLVSTEVTQRGGKGYVYGATEEWGAHH